MIKFKSKDEVMKKAEEALGKTFGELDIYGRLIERGNKGVFGQIIEESIFEYDINNRAEADIPEVGVEIKVTPYKRNKNGTYSAKERLVLNVIDYNSEYKYDFYTSSFWAKNQSLLLFFYLYEMYVPKEFYTITHVILYNYPEEDLEIIKKDWETIVNKIRQGKAHELSESDTMYLGACCKGQDSNSLREQPFSKILAKQRAFSLKQSYMTSLLRNYVLGDKTNERIIKDVNQLKSMSFEDIIIGKLKDYFGKTQEELLKLFNMSTTAKNINEILLSRMLGIQGRVSETDEFQKANIAPKTIRLNSDGTITESMSFPAFKFTEIIKEQWEESEIRDYFESTKFMFVIYKYNEKNQLYFDSVKFWRMPNDDLDNELSIIWEKTVEVIRSGNVCNKITYNKKGDITYHSNFPKKSDSIIAHVRPHGRNNKDTYPLPIPDKKYGLKHYPKQCFFLNNDYIANQLRK